MQLIQFPDICASGQACKVCRGTSRAAKAWQAEHGAPVVCLFPTAATDPRQSMRGLGDVVAKVTKAVGISACGGCRKRQKALNKLVPFNE